MFYIIVILSANLLITLFNSIGGGNPVKTLLLSLLATAAVIAYDGATAFLIRRLPEKWFCAENKAFNVSRMEKRIYAKLNVKKTVGLVPELGGFTNFHKDKLKSTDDADYLARFILESNYGVVIHLVNAFGGWVIGFIPWVSGAIWIPVVFTNFILSMMPVFILRNNTPALVFLYNRAQKTK